MANKNAKKRAAKNRASSIKSIKTEEVVLTQEQTEQTEQVAQGVDTKVQPENKVVVEEKKSKVVDQKTKEKNKSKKKKKEKKPSKIVKKTKETFSELKKVTWPTFPTVVKQTGVVLAVVIFFTVVLFGFESLLGWLFSLLTKS